MGNPIFFGHNQALGAAFSFFQDDFNRANSASLGSNWFEFSTGFCSIVSNTLRFQDSTQPSGAMWQTPADRATQWSKFTVAWDVSGNDFGVYFRCDAADPGSGYYLFFDNSSEAVGWFGFTPSGTGQIGSGVVIGVNNGDIFGCTVQGLGTSTVVRVWANPSGFPISSANWNGDTTPNATFTTNPSFPQDAGRYLGVWGTRATSSSILQFDNWSAGTCAD